MLRDEIIFMVGHTASDLKKYIMEREKEIRELIRSIEDRLNGRELGIIEGAITMLLLSVGLNVYNMCRRLNVKPNDGCFIDALTTIYAIAYISAESLANSVDDGEDGSVMHT